MLFGVYCLLCVDCFFVLGHLLVVVCCVLRVVCCSLRADGCVVSVDCCLFVGDLWLLFVVAVRCVMFVA